MKQLLLLLAALLLMGQDCNQTDPPEGGNEYCAGNDYSVLKSLEVGWERDGVTGAWSAILGGEQSANRRATVWVRFGSGYCSGVALLPGVALTAAHCGHAADDHKIEVTKPTGELTVDGFPVIEVTSTHRVTDKLPHPDYLEYVRSGNLEARKADLMLLYIHPDDPLPEPFIGQAVYGSGLSQACRGLIAQGLGRHEGSGVQLREAKYLITRETDKYLISRASEREGESGWICFGDSGGPLYADVAGQLMLAGITTTTMSRDCLTGGTHVKLAHFKPWVEKHWLR